VSEVVTLSLRAPLDQGVEVEGLTPDRLALLDERDIALLPVWVGSRAAQIGEFFRVTGGRSARVRIEGDLSRVDGIGAGTVSGEIVIEGSGGSRVAAGMTGGRIEVRGNVGQDAGLAMEGGALIVRGNAGDRLGAAVPGAAKGMTGGEIVVTGSAGREAAAHARRGLIVVVGDVGNEAGRAMIAGSLVVFGLTGEGPGRSSKRGSIVAAGGIDIPRSYRYACTYRPPHVRLTMTYLRRRYGLTIDERLVAGRYRRYCGDAGEPGKGEILEWIAE
jgi:formylmethanofuran dehydrogenase subunit C